MLPRLNLRRDHARKFGVPALWVLLISSFVCGLPRTAWAGGMLARLCHRNMTQCNTPCYYYPQQQYYDPQQQYYDPQQQFCWELRYYYCYDRCGRCILTCGWFLVPCAPQQGQGPQGPEKIDLDAFDKSTPIDSTDEVMSKILAAQGIPQDQIPAMLAVLKAETEGGANPNARPVQGSNPNPASNPNPNAPSGPSPDSTPSRNPGIFDPLSHHAALGGRLIERDVSSGLRLVSNVWVIMRSRAFERIDCQG